MDKDEEMPRLFEGSKKIRIVPPKGTLTEHGDVSWNSIVILDGQTKTCAELTLQELSKSLHEGLPLKSVKHTFMKK